MGVISHLLNTLFGGGLSEVRRTVEVFRENTEAGAERGHDMQRAALDQLAQEFARDQRGVFDRIMDGLNRLPRPGLALGTLGLFIAAMVDPVWFAARMQGISLVPEPLWWLLGVIVSFYFGARHQAKAQAFQAQLGRSMARLPQVMAQVQALEGQGKTIAPQQVSDENPALTAWHNAANSSR